MRSVRMRILVTLLVLAIVGIGGWQLLPSQGNKNKTITVGTTDAVTSLDPAGAYDAGSWALFNNVFQSLLAFEPDGVQPVPDAAESCKFTDSGLRTYRCELREGITFPSGREMTAEDVKYSFDRVKKINSDVGPASLFSTLSSVTAAGRTVTFHLSSPDATFPFKVATGAGSIVDKDKYPANGLRTDNGVDGTGPYTLTSYTRNKQATLQPNGHYKGELSGTGRPVKLDYYTDSAKLAAAYKAKDIDVATRTLPPAMVSKLNPSDPTQRVTESDSSETRNLYLNTRKNSPLHDPLVRRALAWLVNREQLAHTVYDGTVEPLYSLIPTGLTGHTTSFFDQYPTQSVAKARALLEQAGVSTPVEFSFGYGIGHGSGAEEAVALAVSAGEIPVTALHGLSPVVFAAAEGGDAVARGIVERLGDEIVAMVTALLRRLRLLRTATPVVLGGGTLQNDQLLLRDHIGSRLAAEAPLARPVVLDVAPVAGAVAQALVTADAPADAQDRLRKTIADRRPPTAHVD
ncbi:ABC transporter substrate-binding protein [Streptomyces sp. NPDC005921]